MTILEKESYNFWSFASNTKHMVFTKDIGKIEKVMKQKKLEKEPKSRYSL